MLHFQSDIEQLIFFSFLVELCFLFDNLPVLFDLFVVFESHSQIISELQSHLDAELLGFRHKIFKFLPWVVDVVLICLDYVDVEGATPDVLTFLWR